MLNIPKRWFPPAPRAGPAALKPGQHRVVAARLHEVFTDAGRGGAHGEPPAPPRAAPASDLSGVWDVAVRFTQGESRHRFELAVGPTGAISGRHHGALAAAALRGTAEGRAVELHSTLRVASTSIGIEYRFRGVLRSAAAMGGELEVSQDDCGGATWEAVRGGGRL